MLIIGFVVLPLDRKVSPLWRLSDQVELDAVSEMDLRYEYFWSRIIFMVDGVDIGGRWGNMPLLDFAASIKRVSASLVQHREAELTFTENSAVVSFVRDGDIVRVGDAVSRDVVSCSLQDLVHAVGDFMKKVDMELGRAHPQIRNNGFFKSLMRESQ